MNFLEILISMFIPSLHTDPVPNSHPFGVSLGTDTLPWSVSTMYQTTVLESNCGDLLQDYGRSSNSAKKFRESDGYPSKIIPPTLRADFTMGGNIKTEKFYVDDSRKGAGTHYTYPAKTIEHMIAYASKKQSNKPSDRWIFDALSKHDITGANVLVVGSMEPWFESVALAHGARHVTVLEYNNLTYGHPHIRTLTPRELLPFLEDLGGVCNSADACEGGWPAFDVAISISSIDHDGLGRYGDPVHPFADLRMMRMMHCMMRQPGARLFLSVPVGPDVLAWNLHRRYGRQRLPFLLRGWTLVDAFGWDAQRLDAPASYRRSYEPVLVLQA